MEEIDELLTSGETKNFKLYDSTNDSFFDCLAVAINSIKSKQQTTEKLRNTCKYIAEQKYDNPELLEILKRRDNFTTVTKYFDIQNNFKQEKFGIKPILGLPEVEGVLISEKLNFKLHILEFNKESKECVHKIIKGNTPSIVDKSTISYKDTNWVHIVRIDINQFKAIISKNPKNADSKRPGTTNYGHEYESEIATFLAVRCGLDDAIKDFLIETNVDGYGAFDDVVLKITLQNGKEHLYLIQVKHRKKPESFHSAFETKNGIFYLQEYNDDYLKLKEAKLETTNFETVNLILFTNTSFFGKPLKGLKQYNKDNKMISLINTKINTGQNITNVYQIENTEYEKDFLSNLFVITEQINPNDINLFLKNELKRTFGENVDQSSVNTIQKYFNTWNKHCNKKMTPINKIRFRELLFDSLTYHHLNIPKDIPKEEAKIFEIVINTFTHFNLASIEQENADKLLKYTYSFIEKLFCKINLTMYPLEDDLNKSQLEVILNEKDFECYREQFNNILVVYGCISKKDIILTLSKFKKIPLALSYNEQNESFINNLLEKLEDVFRSRSISLVITSSIKRVNKFSNMFENLLNLKHLNLILYKKNIESINFQLLQNGNTVCLSNIVNETNENEIVQSIDPDTYLNLTYKILNIGQNVEDISCHVQRSIKFAILSKSVINEHTQLFILVDHSKYPNYDGPNILRSNLNLEESINTANLNYTLANKSVHVLRPITENVLQWVYSVGSVSNISKYQVENIYPECTTNDILSLLNINRVQTICCRAGMGKTTLLKKIQQLEQTNRLCIFINVSKRLALLENITNLHEKKTFENLTKLLNDNTPNVMAFSQVIFLNLFKAGQITWLIDGFDEIDTNKIQPFLNCIKNTQNKMFIATRASKKNEVLNQFNILCLDLVPFSKCDQISFFKQYCQGKFSDEVIENKLNSLSKIDENVIGIPLQTQLCAYLFETYENIENIQISVVFLFNEFLAKIFSNENEEYETKVSKLSLTVFFNKELLKEAGIFSEEINHMIEAFKKNNVKDSIISGFNEANEPVFTHKSYAEFLCAKWLAKKLLAKDSVKFYKIIYKKLFSIELIQVRMLFDKIVCENFELHSAVLDNNIEKVKQLLDKDNTLLNVKDGFDRTALHLAASYGKKTNIQLLDDVKDNKFMTNILVDECDTNLVISDEILKYLIIKKADITKDNLLGENPIGHSLLSSAIENANLLCKHYKESIPTSKSREFLIFYSYLLNLEDLFENVLANDRSYITNKKFNGEYLLISIARTGKCKILRKILNIGVNVEEEIEGKTILEVAIENNQLDIVKVLAEFGFDFMKKNSKGENALMFAKRKGCQSIVKWLSNSLKKYFFNVVSNGNLSECKEIIVSGISVNYISEKGESPFIIAFREGHWKVAEYLFFNETDLSKRKVIVEVALNLATETGGKNEILLHYAILLGKISLFKKILNLNLNINYMYKDVTCRNTNISKISPLHLAAATAHKEIFNILLEKGAETTKLASNGRSLIHFASISDNIEVLTQVFNMGLNIESEDELKQTALLIAAKNGCLKSVNFLLDKKADWKKLDNIQQNLLHHGCMSDDVNIITKILDLGLLIDSEDKHNRTALLIAAQQGKLNSLNFLLERKADWKKLDNIQQNVLHHACMSDNIEVLKRVLDLGINIDSVDSFNRTPLHIAAQNGKLNCLNVLLERGANWTFVTAEHENLLHLAVWSKNISVLEAVLRLSIDVNCRNKDNKTPLDIAYQCKSSNVVKFLLAHDKIKKYH